MIFFAQSAANQQDLVAREAERAGSQQVRTTGNGVQFTGDLRVGYRFTMTSRIASRVYRSIRGWRPGYCTAQAKSWFIPFLGRPVIGRYLFSGPLNSTA